MFFVNILLLRWVYRYINDIYILAHTHRCINYPKYIKTYSSGGRLTSLDIQKGCLKAVSQMTDLELCLKCEETIQCCSPKAKNRQADEQNVGKVQGENVSNSKM